MSVGDEMMAIFHRRHSCRHYLEREVSEEALAFCLEAVALAPSACNRKPWQLVTVRDPELRLQICRHGLLPGIPMPWLAGAPVIMVLCARRELVTHRLAPLFSGIDYLLLDCGIAGEHLVLAATALGLGTCWIGWFRPRYVKKLLHLGWGVQPVALISVGYPAEPADSISAARGE
ncbi:MAG: nitroreductase family protein [Victivallales bacterium]|nr:nitroreductase family protein [Victivallales bacterium]